MNARNLGKGDLDELDKIMKSVLQREKFHGRQPSDESFMQREKRV